MTLTNLLHQQRHYLLRPESLLLLGFLVFSAGCQAVRHGQNRAGYSHAPLSSEEIWARAQRRLTNFEQRRDGEMVWALCENPPRPGHCGTVWNELLRKDEITVFI